MAELDEITVDANFRPDSGAGATFSNNHEDDDGSTAASFTDPLRTPAQYNLEVLGGTESQDEWLEMLLNRGCGEWDDEAHNANAINNWFREGFDMEPV